MKKSILISLICISLSLLVCSIASAAEISATLPAGTFSAKMTKITANAPWDGTTDVWGTPGPVGNISFGTLTELVSAGPVPPAGTALAIFAPADRGYYAIDIGFGGGGGMSADLPNVTITYGGSAELRERTVTVYKLMNYLTGEPAGTKLYMSDSVPTWVGNDASYQGGNWVRIYLGINTNWDTGTDPSGNHVFTYASPSGSFTATMTITIT